MDTSQEVSDSPCQMICNKIGGVRFNKARLYTENYARNGKGERAKSNFFKNSEIISNNIHFQGQYFNGETGLHYNRYHYYSPYLARFISKDPSGVLGGYIFMLIYRIQ